MPRLCFHDMTINKKFEKAIIFIVVAESVILVCCNQLQFKTFFSAVFRYHNAYYLVLKLSGKNQNINCIICFDTKNK